MNRNDLEWELERDLIEAASSIKDKKPNLLGSDLLICECNCVSVLDIRDNYQSVDLDELKEDFRLGTACGTCVRDKDQWINKIF